MRSELNPAVQDRLTEASNRGIPRPSELSISGARDLFDGLLDQLDLLDDPEPVGDVREYSIPGPPPDCQPISLRIYTPSGNPPFPVLIFLRGSLWCVGGLDLADDQCRRITNESGFAVVSVDYQLAPEHPFPEPLEDAYAAMEWVHGHPDVIQGDPDCVAIGGISSGANLAAATALLARDRGGPKLAFQLLVAPALAYDFETVSYRENAAGYGLTREDMEHYWTRYLSDPIHARNDYACPLTACDISDLPPAAIVTGGFDVLRDDGILYRDRLLDADIKVDHLNYPDMPHPVIGTVDLATGVERAQEAISDIATVMNRLS